MNKKSGEDDAVTNSPKQESIPVTFDKSHLLTIGERLYATSLDLVRENFQASRVLKDALDKIGRALKRTPDALGDFGDPPIGAEAGEVPGASEGAEEGYSISKAQIVDAGPPPGAAPDEQFETSDQKKPTRRRHLGLANRAIIRRMQFRNLGVVCRMERFGPESPPSVLESGIIYINIDHPLYRKQQESDQLLQVFLTSLISKELALKKHAHDAGEAFRLQHELLTEAFRHLKKL